MASFKSIDWAVGGTPIIECAALAEKQGATARIFAKVEYMNPWGSVKDRVALSMINEAEREGRLKSGATIIEPTSGNTGIGLCAVAAARGYKAVIVMPDTMSPERIKIMRGYGAEVVLTPGALGMSGAIAKAEELAAVTEGAFVPSQFENPANPKAHYETTGPEIYRDMQTKVDIFVAGVGTGGTISGTGKYLKEQNKDIKIVAVEPDESPVLSGGDKGPHGIQGIGAGFVPKTLDRDIIDEVIRVRTADAKAMRALVGKEMGMLVGISSGAALSAALTLAKREENRDKNIVVILPDSGERYLSVED